MADTKEEKQIQVIESKAKVLKKSGKHVKERVKKPFNWKLFGKVTVVVLLFAFLAALTAGEYLLYSTQRSYNTLIKKLNESYLDRQKELTSLSGRVKTLEGKVGTVTKQQSQLEKQVRTNVSSWQTYTNSTYNYSVNYPSNWAYADKTSGSASYVKSLIEFKLTGGSDYITVTVSSRSWSQTLQAYGITKQGADYKSGGKKLSTTTVAGQQAVIKPLGTNKSVVLFQLNGRVFEVKRSCDDSVFSQMLSTFSSSSTTSNRAAGSVPTRR